MSKRLLPERPHPDHLRSQAKELLAAVRAGDPDAAVRLVRSLPSFAGLTPEQTRRRTPALHDAQSAIAREYGFPSWVKLLDHVEEQRARAGVDADAASRFIESALSDRIQTLQRLLELYPGVSRFDPVCALAGGEIEAVQRWIESSPPDAAVTPLGPKNWLPLEYVCHSRIFRARPDREAALVRIAQMLLGRGADPNSSHAAEGHDPGVRLSVLYGASGATGHLGLARLLLERGADPNDGESVYHAAQHDRREILQALLDHGADISSADPRWGNTPVYFLMGYRESDPGAPAALRGVEWLLEHGADPNVLCGRRERETALHAACLNRRGGKVIELLLSHGADPSIRRADGRTATELALMANNREAVEALRRRGATATLSPKDAFLAACAAADRSAIRSMLNAAPELASDASLELRHMLCKLAEVGDAAAAGAILDAKLVSPDDMTCGQTPLHFACFCGWAEAARTLLAAGARIDLLDKTYDATPLGWAMEGVTWNRNPRGDYVDVIRALLDAGVPQSEAAWHLDSEEAPIEIMQLIAAHFGRDA